jgi:SAM-dependent methyltransferase
VHVWQCRVCGHLFGEEMAGTREYYASDYKILLDHDDEDQIYEIRNGQIVYRTEHQLAVLTRKLPLAPGTRLLDYGCAKASMPKRMLAQQPELQVHLFDVSSMYREHWRRFLTDERCAVDTTPDSWQGSFDVVTSFFALEHIPEPQPTVYKIRSLLREDGCFYGIVPDTVGNYSDFVVVDHVNHFTPSSLFLMLRKAGFRSINIAHDVHRGAFVFTARPTGEESPPPPVDLHAARGVATFWKNIGRRIHEAESRYAGAPAAIYGSGFYGTYIATLLKKQNALQCFLDASPYQQGKRLMERQILPPAQLPLEVKVLYIGLNPSIARATVAAMGWIKPRNLDIVYLDEDNA